MAQVVIGVVMARKSKDKIKGNISILGILHYLAHKFKRKPESPDYVQCPHCGEPEVEVWLDDRESICHSCGNKIELRGK